MSAKAKDKQRQLQKAKYDHEKAMIQNFRQMSLSVKPVLRQVCCDLPFYDFLDSYAEEFTGTVSSAMKALPSLLSICEVDEKDFENPDWSKFGAAGYQQVFFNLDERFTDYGKKKGPKANIRGSATFFRNGDAGFRSIVLIPRNPNCGFEYGELKYAFKVGSLLHELGHVHDAEQRINIDPVDRRFDLIETEAYANCYALERLAERCLAHTYSMLYGAMQSLLASNGYEADIGRLVLERHPRRQIPDWQDFMNAAKQKEFIHC